MGSVTPISKHVAAGSRGLSSPQANVRTPARAPDQSALTQLNLPATGGRRGEYALADVARPLGMLHLGERSIIDRLRALARHDGMPLPRTPRVVNDTLVRGPASIVRNSRWDAGEIDAWLDGRGKGPSSPAPARPLPQPVRDEMARRAAEQAQPRRIGGAA